MVNDAVAAIIAALFAAFGGFVGTLSTGWWTHRNERLKRQREEQDIIRKYRDPLLRASERLQSRIWRMLEQPIAVVDELHMQAPDLPESYEYTFTLYLFGAFFAWSRALQTEVHKLHHEPSAQDQVLQNVLYEIERTLHRPHGHDAKLFQVYIGMQAAIGEVMTQQTHDSQGVIQILGYSDFVNRWIADGGRPGEARQQQTSFRIWFSQIVAGLKDLHSLAVEPKLPPPHNTTAEGPDDSFPIPPPTDIDAAPSRNPKLNRLISVQHLLVDLIEVVDPHYWRSHEHVRERIAPPQHGRFSCLCSACPWPEHSEMAGSLRSDKATSIADAENFHSRPVGVRQNMVLAETGIHRLNHTEIIYNAVTGSPASSKVAFPVVQRKNVASISGLSEALRNAWQHWQGWKFQRH